MNTLILESTTNGDIPVDVYQKLADDRIIFITDHINDMIATDIIATLLLKDYENHDEKITIFINSSGGDIRNILSIYDVMQMITSPIETICIGSAMEESVILLAGGTKGMRFATMNSSIAVSPLIQEWMTHTNLIDGKNLLDQLVIDHNKILDILAKTTGKRIMQIRKDFERKVFFSATKALKYNLIDKVIQPKHAKSITND